MIKRLKDLPITPLKTILFLVIILRIPNLFEPYWYGDEAIYMALGEGVRQGLILYKDIFDHKLPAIYILAAIAGSIFWFKFILLVWHTVTVYLFWKFSERILSQSQIPGRAIFRATLFATSFFAILTTLPTIEGNIANAELFMAGPTIAALYFIFDKKVDFKKLFYAGALFSLAILFKVPSIFDAFTVIAFWGICSLWKWKDIQTAFKNSIPFGIGILLPILLTTAYFYSVGAGKEFLAAGFGLNLDYISRWSTPTVSSGKFEANLIFRAEILALLLILILVFKKFFDKVTLFCVIWLCFTLFALLLSGRPYPHYVIQAVAPLALLVSIIVNAKDKYRFLPVPFIFIFLFALNFYGFSHYPTLPYYKNFINFVSGKMNTTEYLSSFDKRVPRTYDLARSIVSRTQKGDRIFIWGTEPELYALSRHLPPGKYTTSFHISDFKGEKETIDVLYSNSPKYIIKIQNETRNLPGLDSLLQERYILLETVEGAEIWKRIPDTILKTLRTKP